MIENVVTMDMSECCSLWKEQAKWDSVWHHSDLSMNNDNFQSEYEPKTSLCCTDWMLKVHIAWSHIARLLVPGESGVTTGE